MFKNRRRCSEIAIFLLWKLCLSESAHDYTFHLVRLDLNTLVDENDQHIARNSCSHSNSWNDGAEGMAAGMITTTAGYVGKWFLLFFLAIV